MCQFILENQSKVREKSVKSQGICLGLTAGNPGYIFVDKNVYNHDNSYNTGQELLALNFTNMQVLE